MRFLLLLIMIFAFGLAACGSDTAVSEPTAQPEVEVEPTAISEEGAEPETVEPTGFEIGAEADQVRTFVIDPARSSASYLVDEEFFADALAKFNIQPGESDVVGSTNEISGELQINFGNPELLESGTFVVNLVSLTTDQNRRDDYIRDNHLESNKFPEASFVLTSIAGLPETYTLGEAINFDLTGDLTIRDLTREVTFNTTATLENGVLSGVARLPLQMTDFGIEPPNFINTLTVANEFVIQVEFTAVEG